MIVRNRIAELCQNVLVPKKFVLPDFRTVRYLTSEEALRMWEDGGFWCWDEVDNMNPEVIAKLNAGMAC